MNLLNQLQKKIQISQRQLNIILVDITRILDKNITKIIKQHHLRLNYTQRKQVRAFLLGYPIHIKTTLTPFNLTNQPINQAKALIQKGYQNNTKQLMDNIIARYNQYFTNKYSIQNQTKRYLKYIYKIQKNKYQLLYLNVSPKLTSNQINNFIKNNYDKLSNYHNCVITFNYPNFDSIAKVAIFMTNFKQEYHFHTFNAYNKKSRIKVLLQFLKQNKHIKLNKQLKQMVKQFYSGVSYGFRFIDLLIADDCSKATLVMQKVQLNENPIRCPICFHKSSKGNSYPHVLFKSFECNNPQCPATSKSGRGKRYTFLSAKCQTMINRNNPLDKINQSLLKAFHLDIIKHQHLNLASAIKLYTWAGDKVLAINNGNHTLKYQGRIIKQITLQFKRPKSNLYGNLLIVQLLKCISNKIVLETKNILNNVKSSSINNQILINGNSNQLTQILNNKNLKIGSAITSPPYYNARQYSQWNNFLCYLIDMMINANNVHQIIKKHGVYIYNVGDIVGQDKVFIKSRMSINRIMLGFWSMLILKLAGFNFCGDIIWNKGQVQSHRNSNANHFPMYIKPDNCYEHNLIMCKGKYTNQPNLIKNRIVNIPPVKKINSQGKNTVGHSAPFPIKLAKLILPFSNPNEYILDSFVGSGTTCKMAEKYGYKSIGVELSNKYYQLAKKRIKNAK